MWSKGCYSAVEVVLLGPVFSAYVRLTGGAQPPTEALLNIFAILFAILLYLQSMLCVFPVYFVVCAMEGANKLFFSIEISIFE